MDRTIVITLKVELKHLMYNIQKSFEIVCIFCLAFFLLTQCSASNISPFSVCPNNVPKGITLVSVKIDGLYADFFHGMFIPAMLTPIPG